MSNKTDIRRAALEGVEDGRRSGGYTDEQARFMSRIINACHDYAGDKYEIDLDVGDAPEVVARMITVTAWDGMVRKFCGDFIYNVDNDGFVPDEDASAEIQSLVDFMQAGREG